MGKWEKQSALALWKLSQEVPKLDPATGHFALWQVKQTAANAMKLAGNGTLTSAEATQLLESKIQAAVDLGLDPQVISSVLGLPHNIGGSFVPGKVPAALAKAVNAEGKAFTDAAAASWPGGAPTQAHGFSFMAKHVPPVTLGAPGVTAPAPAPVAKKPKAAPKPKAPLVAAVPKPNTMSAAELAKVFALPPGAGVKPQSYGCVVVDAQGRVMVRRPTGGSPSSPVGFGGVAWTFPKGRQDPGETPQETAAREVLEEVGHKVIVGAAIPGNHPGSVTNTAYFLGHSVSDSGVLDNETAELRWVTRDEAKALMALSTNDAARLRDLAVLDAAMAEWDKQQALAAPAAPKKLTKAAQAAADAAAKLAADAAAKAAADAAARVAAQAAATAARVAAKAAATKAAARVALQQQKARLRPVNLPPAVAEAMRGVWRQADKIAPEHKAKIQAIAAKTLKDLEGRMQGLAQGKYTTVATASKALQLQALAERLGYDHGAAMGSELEAQGRAMARLSRGALVKQLDGWEQFSGLKQLAAPEFASDLLSDGLLERYEVSRRTYGMDAIKAMREEFAAGALTGESLKVTWDRVAARVSIPEWRAERIVRTEHSFAIHARALGDMQAAYPADGPEGGLWVKELVSIFDQRTGKDSVYVNGQQRALDKPFEDNEGRVYMAPPNRPNDREVMVFVPAELPSLDELRAVAAARDDARIRAETAAAAALAAKVKAEADEAARLAVEAKAIADAAAKKKAEDDALAAAKVAADPFPADPRTLKVVKRLGGSTGAELVEDDLGRRFVRKLGANPAHLREEWAADEAYRALGANVPPGRFYDAISPPVKLTQFIEGKPLADVMGTPLGKKAVKDLQKHFAADALLGSWDVTGANNDNVLVTPDGKAWRIDNGGSLRFRAQGAPKGAAFGDHPMELWSLRKQGVGPGNTSKASFGALGIEDLETQAKAIKAKRAKLDNALALALPGDMAIRNQINARLDAMLSATAVGGAMVRDKFKADYADDLARHWMGLDQAGVVAAMPKALKPANGQVTVGGYNSNAPAPKPVTFAGVPYFNVAEVKDDKGKPWDDLRGSRSIDPISKKAAAYMASVGGDWGLVEAWAGSQAGGSWNDRDYGTTGVTAVSIKRWLGINARKGSGSKTRYWGASGVTSAVQNPTPIVYADAKVRESVLAFHAFSARLAAHVSLPVHRARGKSDPAYLVPKEAPLIRVFRTEPPAILRGDGIALGDKGKLMSARGILESTSVFSPVEANAGGAVTVQEVPPWRVFGTYFHDRTDRGSGDMFYGDRENEFTVFLDDVPFDYVGNMP